MHACLHTHWLVPGLACVPLQVDHRLLATTGGEQTLLHGHHPQTGGHAGLLAAPSASLLAQGQDPSAPPDGAVCNKTPSPWPRLLTSSSSPYCCCCCCCSRLLKSSSSAAAVAAAVQLLATHQLFLGIQQSNRASKESVFFLGDWNGMHWNGIGMQGTMHCMWCVRVLGHTIHTILALDCRRSGRPRVSLIAGTRQ